MEFKPAIIMYTISDDATRDEFRRQLAERYGDALEELDQSTYAIPLLAIRPADEVVGLRAICNVMVQNNFVFDDDDTFKFCCSAIRLDYHPGDYEYGKIAIEDVFDGVNRRRARLND